MDLFGPTQYTSIDGNKYGFVIVDDYTRYTWVFFLVDKSDIFAIFKTNTRIDELCDEFGIRHQFSTKYTPQSNDLVERKNRTFIDMTRSMLSEYNMSQSFWAKAINMSCYCSNCLYCHPLKEKTPYELFNGRKPNIAYFRVWLQMLYLEERH